MEDPQPQRVKPSLRWVGSSSLTRDQTGTHASCIGSAVSHWNTREVLSLFLIYPEYDRILPSPSLHPNLRHRFPGAGFHLDHCDHVVTSFPASAFAVQ